MYCIDQGLQSENELIAIEMQDVYFKGCGDYVVYLKKAKLL